MGLFTKCDYTTTSEIIQIALYNINMSDEDFDEFIERCIHTNNDGHTIFGSLTPHVEKALVMLTVNRVISKQNIKKIFTLMNTWTSVITGKYILNYTWIIQMLKNSEPLDYTERQFLIKINYPKLKEYYNSIIHYIIGNNIEIYDDEIIYIIQYMSELLFNFKLIDKKILIKKLKNIVLTDDNVQIFLKNTTSVSIIDKMKYMLMCNYKLDFNSTIINLGRDIKFNEGEYVMIPKDIKIIDPINICDLNGHVNIDVINLIKYINRKLNANDLFKTINELQLTNSNVLIMTSPVKSDTDKIKLILSYFEITTELFVSLFFALNDLYKNILSYKTFCVLVSIDKIIDYSDISEDAQIFDILYASSFTLNINNQYANISELLRLSCKFKKQMSTTFVKVGMTNVITDYYSIDPLIGFKYACIYLDYNMILYYLNQKYIPTKEYVMYVLLGGSAYISEHLRRISQNKIFVAFYNYGMHITEEIFDLINIPYDFNTWEFTKDLPQIIKDKFKAKKDDNIIKNINNINRLILNNQTESHIIQQYKQSRILNSCKLCYSCAFDKINNVINEIKHSKNPLHEKNIYNCDDIYKCMEMSIFNGNIEVFEYIYETYLNEKKYKPSIISISMIYNYARKCIMIKRFYSE